MEDLEDEIYRSRKQANQQGLQFDSTDLTLALTDITGQFEKAKNEM